MAMGRDLLTTWLDEWKMFDISIKHVLHTSKVQVHCSYFMNTEQLEDIRHKKDFGTVITNDNYDWSDLHVN